LKETTLPRLLQESRTPQQHVGVNFIKCATTASINAIISCGAANSRDLTFKGVGVEVEIKMLPVIFQEGL
jgi:hypothetical protein